MHVAKVGHTIRSCQGRNSGSRFAHHEWIPGYLEDVVVPVDAFHLDDRLAKAPKHEKRFEVDRIPAILELCSQAGVDLPDHPTLRRTSPVAPKRRAMQDDVESDMEMNSEMGLGDLPLVDRRPWDTRRDEEIRTTEIDEMQYTTPGSTQKDVFRLSGNVTLEEDLLYSDFEEGNFEDRHQFQAWSEEADVNAFSDEDDMQTVAQKTLQAWDILRWGATLLMKSYPVKACGYCPEVHIGPSGHKVRMCGAFKHQWRNGQHGWQEAALDDLIPPRSVNSALLNKCFKYLVGLDALMSPTWKTFHVSATFQRRFFGINCTLLSACSPLHRLRIVLSSRCAPFSLLSGTRFDGRKPAK